MAQTRTVLTAFILTLDLHCAGQATSPVAPFTMVNLTSKVGIDFRQVNYATETKYPFETLGGAVACFDYNNDGWLDLFFLNGAPSPEHLRKDPASFNRLYRNRGDGTFEEVTAKSGLSGEGIKGYPQGVATGDYDNDGFVDLLITQFGDNVLYHNNGDGTFGNVTAKAGVAMGRHPFKASAAWIDIDNDGWLDLFVTHYFQWTFQNNAEDFCGEHKPGYRTYCTPDVFKPLPNVLFKNNRDGTFTDISDKAGITPHLGKGMGISIADFDDDGWMDVFVTNDKTPNFLYHNQRNSTFKEVALQGGVYANESGAMVSGMGCDFNDYNNDGLPDIFYTDLVKELFTLFQNQGKGIFMDATFPSNLGRLTAPHSGWSNKLCDLDNDGWKDIFVAGSHVVDNVEMYNPNHRYQETCFLFRNLGNGKFENLTGGLGPDFQVIGGNRGIAVGDYDNDGALEVVVSRLNDVPLFFRKNGGTRPHWLLLSLRGTRSNRDGIGAKIKLTLPSGNTQFNHVTTAHGIYSASDKRVHFGLGEETAVREIEIRWPSGAVQKLGNTPADQVLTVMEPES